VARVRKLFPIYGSALANNVLVALTHDRVVAGFVAGYMAEYDRRGILGGPARDRELAETIGREILLAMFLEVREALPSFFGKQQKRKPKPDEKQAIELFSAELLAALIRAKNWNGADRKEFLRDLSLYSDFGKRREKAAATPKRGKIVEEESPFIARVALLLDPSMLEQARRATRKFHLEVGRLARKLLRQTLG
jgi:hypothetical protein